MSRISAGPPRWNYLRVRGEYASSTCMISTMVELPPRARRIPHHAVIRRNGAGTTSACAENTSPTCCCARWGWNYLRVRGEYSLSHVPTFPAKELPPRARRIRPRIQGRKRPIGTTSACAENTQYANPSGSHAWNYLRVRGEYVTTLEERLDRMELPPRARRILLRSLFQLFCEGTTSACAENT